MASDFTPLAQSDFFDSITKNKDLELWLIQAPKHIDTDVLDGLTLPMTNTKKSQEACISLDLGEFIFELSPSSSDTPNLLTCKRGGWQLGPRIARTAQIRQCVSLPHQIKPVSLPKPKAPAGLRMRCPFIGFGSNLPLPNAPKEEAQKKTRTARKAKTGKGRKGEKEGRTPRSKTPSRTRGHREGKAKHTLAGTKKARSGGEGKRRKRAREGDE
eukprot:gnl/Trimastix_PCT/996.p3 GENE.gnl/Trimastix_PCT/996~~gnl/Trimastix_PCT/996.p3  ORF type:complete len:231 (+),score=36.31 gnl/Trimastix_PCT/996:52-693(+)